MIQKETHSKSGHCILDRYGTWIFGFVIPLIDQQHKTKTTTGDLDPIPHLTLLNNKVDFVPNEKVGLNSPTDDS